MDAASLVSGKELGQRTWLHGACYMACLSFLTYLIHGSMLSHQVVRVHYDIGTLAREAIVFTSEPCFRGWIIKKSEHEGVTHVCKHVSNQWPYSLNSLPLYLSGVIYQPDLNLQLLQIWWNYKKRKTQSSYNICI